MKSTEGRIQKKAAIPVDQEMFKNIFGSGSTVAPSTRVTSNIRRMNRPKKKAQRNSQLPKDILNDINNTLNATSSFFECPFCFERLAPPYTEELEVAIEKIKTKKEEHELRQKKAYAIKVAKEKAEGKVYIEPFLSNEDGLSEQDKQLVCDVHRMELELKPLARERGYPEDVDFADLESRIGAFQNDLLDIIHGRIESSYLKDVKEKMNNMGSNKAKDTTELINRFQNTMPGYYGMKGAEEMMRILGELFLDKDLKKSKSYPLEPIEYVQQVLIPECGLRLIEQDMKVDRIRAKKIMMESVQYGKKYSL